MTGLLNFNPDRRLRFDPGRPLEFDIRRPLQFDPSRDLLFHQNRDLGFGRRGVVFRGYVCPICGSLVTETATKCMECGAVFESSPRASQPPSPPGPEVRAPERGKAKPAAPSGKADRVYCASCGTALKRTDAFCANCGKATAGSREAVRPTPQKIQYVTRDRRGPRER